MEIMFKPVKFQCERCKTEVDELDNFCSHCGNDLNNMKIYTELEQNCDKEKEELRNRLKELEKGN